MTRLLIVRQLMWIILISFFAPFSLLIENAIAKEADPKEILNHITFYTESFPPFTYENDQGEMEGYAVDIIEKVYLDLKLDKPDIRLKVWDMAYMLTMISKSPSALFLISKTPEREDHFHFSDGILKSKNAIYCNKATGITKLTKSDYQKYKFAAEKQDVNIALLMKEGVPNSNIIIVNSIDVAVEHVAAGRIACLAFSVPVINTLFKSSVAFTKDIALVKELPETVQGVGFNIHIDQSVITLFNQQLNKILENQTYIENLKKQYGVE